MVLMLDAQAALFILLMYKQNMVLHSGFVYVSLMIFNF